VFVGYYLTKNRFVPQSNTKFKLSFMFIGYRNRPIPNVYELVIIFFHFGTAAILVYLRNHPLPQITTLIAWNLIYFCATILMKPFEAIKESVLETINKIVWTCTLVLIGSLAISDLNEDFDPDYREVVGWVIIGMIFCYIIVNFLIAVIQLLFLLRRIKTSSKLIFYDKDDGFSSIHVGKSGIMIGNTKKTDDIEEKQLKKSTFGKLGDLGKKSGDSYFFTENKSKSERETIELDKMKSGKGSGHDSYLSNSDDTFNSQKHSLSNGMRMEK